MSKVDCPKEFKSLVVDLSNCWISILEIRKELESGSITAEKVEEIKWLWQERHSIYRELDHYRDLGKILGEHPIFIRKQFRDELAQMSGPELVKKYNAVRKSLRGLNQVLREQPREDLKESREQQIKDRKWQLEELTEHLKALK